MTNTTNTNTNTTSNIGELERAAQNRVVRLFSQTLGYRYLGNWEKGRDNRNIEEAELRAWLGRRNVPAKQISAALRQLQAAAQDASKSLYDRNRAVYDLLRYGVKVQPNVGQPTQTVWLMDWARPEANDFAFAEEVTVAGAYAHSRPKRPDIVVYINGIALGVIELKRSSVSVSEGIRQNWDNQKKDYIEHFFSTVQWVMAGNDSEGLRYGAIGTREKYYLTWKEETHSEVASPLDRALVQLFNKARFIDLLHNFIVFDAGTKKLPRPNQYFGVQAAQAFVRKREGGVIWHTQGSGKSLTMVWLARWIRENVPDARVLILTDRTELDEQIEKVFRGVNEAILRSRDGAGLIAMLNAPTPWLMCSLIHKFGSRKQNTSEKSEASEAEIKAYVQSLRQALPPGFAPKGNWFVFVDECHRTQSGDLHKAMTELLPAAVLIGFTGTPLLKADKQRSIEVFGRYIHVYKYDEAVRDGVVLDLRYEARDIDQRIGSQERIDQWFDAKTRGLTDVAKAQLKARWGTLQKVYSSLDRLKIIVDDLLMDMATRDRLSSGHGNAMLVAGSIYEACKFYELFAHTELRGKCAIVTSYTPSSKEVKGEDSGEGETENIFKYETYRNMLADWFNEPPETAATKAEEFERQAKKKFVEEPGQMKLLIVVDKLLTGFDAPSATYLYIDQKMQNHGLFQAICRVNRLDGDDKEFGYIVDYKDLFHSLERAIKDYTSGAFDDFDKDDVAGLLKDRLTKARERLEETREAVHALCEPVAPPKNRQDYVRYFCGDATAGSGQAGTDRSVLQENEPRRVALYKHVAAFVRAYANLANELPEAGYTEPQMKHLRDEATHYESVRADVKLASGDYVDLKLYEPAMRHLIDTYIKADGSEKVSAFDDLSLIQLIVERGVDAVDALPQTICGDAGLVAEVIENNVRRLIIDEQPLNPKYYARMSQLLDELIQQRRQGALDYREHLARVVALARQAQNPAASQHYPAAMNTPARRMLYDNLGGNEMLAAIVDRAIRESRQDDWRNNPFKIKKVRQMIRAVLRTHLQDDPPTLQATASTLLKDTTSERYTATPEETLGQLTERIVELAKNQDEY